MNVHSAIHISAMMDANREKSVSEAFSSYRTATSTHSGGSKREAILEAALLLFAERGFHGTPVPLMAKKAGVGAGTIYRYFESKEALVNALYQRWKGRLGELVLTDFQLDASPREQLRQYWTRMCTFVREHPQAFKFLEAHHHGPYLDETSRALEMSILGPALTFIELAQAKGLIKAGPPEVFLAAVNGILVGLVKASWAGYLELTPEILAQGEACAWEAIRA